MKKLSTLLEGVVFLAFLYLTIGLWLQTRSVDASTLPIIYSNLAAGVAVGTLILTDGALIIFTVSCCRLIPEIAGDLMLLELLIGFLAFGWSSSEAGVIFFRPTSIVWTGLGSLALLGFLYTFAVPVIEQRFQDKKQK